MHVVDGIVSLISLEVESFDESIDFVGSEIRVDVSGRARMSGTDFIRKSSAVFVGSHRCGVVTSSVKLQILPCGESEGGIAVDEDVNAIEVVRDSAKLEDTFQIILHDVRHSGDETESGPSVLTISVEHDHVHILGIADIMLTRESVDRGDDDVHWLDVSAAEERFSSYGGEEGSESFIHPGRIVSSVSSSCGEVVASTNGSSGVLRVEDDLIEEGGHGGGHVARGIGIGRAVVHVEEDLRGEQATKVNVETRSSESAKVLKARAAGVRTVSESVEKSQHEGGDVGLGQDFEQRFTTVIVVEGVGGEGDSGAAERVVDKHEGIELEQAVGDEGSGSEQGALIGDGLVQLHYIEDNVGEGVADVWGDVNDSVNAVIVLELVGEIHTLKDVITWCGRHGGAILGGSGPFELLSEVTKFGGGARSQSVVDLGLHSGQSGKQREGERKGSRFDFKRNYILQNAK